jgi:hypothetical protein
MFLDFLEGMDYQWHREFETLLALAMYITKVRLLLEKNRVTLQRLSFFLSKGSKLPQDVKNRIGSFLTTNFNRDLKSTKIMQEKEIPRLLQKIHRHNATILPALVNLEPFNGWKKRVKEEGCGDIYGDNAQVLVALEFGDRDMLAQTSMGIRYLQMIFEKSLHMSWTMITRLRSRCRRVTSIPLAVDDVISSRSSGGVIIG